MSRNIKPIVLIGAIALTAQSCFTAKNYDRPQVQTEDLYRIDTPLSDSTSLADVAWDQLFTDPILQGHINKAIANNYDIRIAIQSIAAAEANRKQGRAGYQPTLSAGTDWTHQELSKNTQFGAIVSDRSIDQYQLTASLAWEADIWGKIRSNARAANALYLRTVAAKQAVQTQLVSDVAAAYFQLLALDAQLKVVDSTLGNRVKSVEVIKQLKMAGNVTEVGVKQTEAQLYATQLIREDLKNNIALLENTFSLLLGESPHTIERSTFDNQKVVADMKTGFPALLLRKRPDVIQAEYNLMNYFELTNVARANFYPALRVTATGGFQSVELSQWLSTNSLFANVVTGLTQPIFNQRRIKTQLEVAKANQQQALLQWQQTLLNAGREVSDAMQTYDNETTKLGIRAQQVDALTRAASYSDELLTYGLVNYLEVLTAKDQQLSTELDLIDNRYRQYNAVITLYKSLGGGWQ